MKVTSTEVKNAFGKYLRICSVEPVYITKNGEVIAKLLNHTESDEIIEDSINLNRIKMNYEEFVSMNEDATQRYEYIDGEVYLLGSPSVFHQRIVSRFHVEMYRYLEGKSCDVFVSPFDVTLLRKGNANFTNIVQPDLLVVCDWTKDTDEKGRYLGIPKLLVEVLSPGNSNKEMFTKLDLYRDSGVSEYWIIDPLRGNAIVYQFENYSIARVMTYTEHDSCESFVYPGFKFRVLE